MHGFGRAEVEAVLSYRAMWEGGKLQHGRMSHHGHLIGGHDPIFLVPAGRGTR